MEDNYLKAYKEVIEILNYLPQESVSKIPQTMIDYFEAKMDKNYDFQVDINKSFEEQKLLNQTKAIFANIFRDYWATPYQKERIEAKEKYDRQIIEKDKSKKYNLDDIFVEKQSILEDEIINQVKYDNCNLPIEVKKASLFEKILNYFKKLFRYKKSIN